MSKIRWIGRDPIYFGKTIFELSAKLANNGHGRVVTRACAQGEPPGGKHFRLTKVSYDLSPSGEAAFFRVGKAFGLELGPNGLTDGPIEITDADLDDWRLVPKTEEEQFVSHLASLPKIEPKKYTHRPPPPILERVLKLK